MNKKHQIIILIIFFQALLVYPVSKKLGIANLYYPDLDTHKGFFLDLDEKLMLYISNLSVVEFYNLNIKSNIMDIKKSIKLMKDKSSDPMNIDARHSTIISQIKNMDYLIACEIKNFQIEKVNDFYNNDKTYLSIKTKLDTIIINCKNKSIIDENSIEVEFKEDVEEKKLLQDAEDRLTKKFNSYISDLSLFKYQIKSSKFDKLFVWLNAGRKNSIKPQDVLIAYEQDEYELKEQSAVKIISSDDDKSFGIILYNKSNLNDKLSFTKTPKINLELQLGGGFSIANKDNPIYTGYYTNIGATFLTFASIRTLIPVGIAFFRPTLQVEFNFFYLNSTLLLPFTFETGCQGEFNLNRFSFDAGFLVGALFSPDSNLSYQLDSVIVRPYLHLAGILTSYVKLYGEVGYKFVLEGIFYKSWNIDMKGIYFNFGLGFCL